MKTAMATSRLAATVKAGGGGAGLGSALAYLAAYGLREAGIADFGPEGLQALDVVFTATLSGLGGLLAALAAGYYVPPAPQDAVVAAPGAGGDPPGAARLRDIA